MTRATADDAPVLNEPQRRHLEVVLSSLQKTLTDIEKLAAIGDDKASDLTVYDRDLPGGFSEQIRSSVASLRNRIAGIVELLGIWPLHRSRAAAMRAAIASAMIKLEDTHSYKMRGYGAVDPSVKTRLDPLIDAMLEDFRSLKELSDAARTSARASAGRDASS